MSHLIMKTFPTIFVAHGGKLLPPAVLMSASPSMCQAAPANDNFASAVSLGTASSAVASWFIPEMRATLTFLPDGTIVTAAVPGDATTEQVTATIPSTSASRFVRLKATR
jgi:hypothetical protein